MKFQCQENCGKCCKGDGKVFLTPLDIIKLEVRLNRPALEFVTEKDGFTFLTKTGEACQFLDGTRCSVHGSHPTQCRTFPFWTGNLKIWEKLPSMCPGMDIGDEVDEAAAVDDFISSAGVVPGHDLTAHF